MGRAIFRNSVRSAGKENFNSSSNFANLKVGKTVVKLNAVLFGHYVDDMFPMLSHNLSITEKEAEPDQRSSISRYRVPGPAIIEMELEIYDYLSRCRNLKCVSKRQLRECLRISADFDSRTILVRPRSHDNATSTTMSSLQNILVTMFFGSAQFSLCESVAAPVALPATELFGQPIDPKKKFWQFHWTTIRPDAWPYS